MPWSGQKDVAKHNQKVSENSVATRIWLTVANERLAAHGDEGRAIREANAAADRVLHKRGNA